MVTGQRQGWIKFESAHKLCMNFNAAFQKKVTLKGFSKTNELKCLFLNSLNLIVLVKFLIDLDFLSVNFHTKPKGQFVNWFISVYVADTLQEFINMTLRGALKLNLEQSTLSPFHVLF